MAKIIAIVIGALYLEALLNVEMKQDSFTNYRRAFGTPSDKSRITAL